MRIFILILSFLIPVQSFAGLPTYSPKVPLFVTKVVDKKSEIWRQNYAREPYFPGQSIEINGFYKNPGDAAIPTPQATASIAATAAGMSNVVTAGEVAAHVAGISCGWVCWGITAASIVVPWWLGERQVDTSATTVSNKIVHVAAANDVAVWEPPPYSSPAPSTLSRGELTVDELSALYAAGPQPVGGVPGLSAKTGLYPPDAKWCAHTSGTPALVPDSNGRWPSAYCGSTPESVGTQVAYAYMLMVAYPAAYASVQSVPYVGLYSCPYSPSVGGANQCYSIWIPASAPYAQMGLANATQFVDLRNYPAGSMAGVAFFPLKRKCFNLVPYVPSAPAGSAWAVWGYGAASCNGTPATSLYSNAFIVSPNPVYTGAHDLDIASLVGSVSDVEMDMDASAILLAHIVNEAWRQASAQPGYAGVPFDALNPVTASDIVALQTAEPATAPKVRDILSPAMYPGTAVAPLTADQIPSGVPRDAFNPVVSTSTTTTVNVNVQPDPNIQAIRNKLEEPATAPTDPTAKTSADFQTALGPLDTALQPLSGWQLPAHSSTCPTWQFTALGHTFNADSHCQFAQDNLSWLSTVFMVLWNIGAVFIILSA